MPGGLSGLTQTLLQLKELDLRRRALDLQEAQQGVQTRATNISILNTLEEVAKRTKDPTKLGAMVPELARMTGQSEDLVGNILGMLTASTETTRDAKVATGADAVPASEVAASTLTGQNLGGIAESGFRSQLFSGASPTLGMRTQAQQFSVNRQQPGAAALDMGIFGLPDNERQQASGIIAGTRLSAPQDAQNQLGFAGLREEQRWHEQQFSLGLASALRDGKGEQAKPSLDAMNFQRQLVDANMGPGVTLTREGWKAFAQQYNGYNRMIELSDPGRVIAEQQKREGKPVTSGPYFPTKDLNPDDPGQYLRARGMFEHKAESDAPLAVPPGR